MKKYLIEVYYNLLIFLEDICGSCDSVINNHRRNLDEKYWEKFLNRRR